MPQELSPHLEGRRWSLFVRLARKRAAYFADIEDLPSSSAIDQVPTRGARAFRQVALQTQPDRRPALMEPGWIVEQPTRPVPVSLLVSAAEQPGGQKRGVGGPLRPGLQLRARACQGTGRRLLSSSWPGAGE